MADFNAENLSTPTRAQKQLGALVIMLCIPFEHFLGTMGHSLEVWAAGRGVAVFQMTPIMIGVGRALSDFWYVVPTIAFAVYAAWISRTANRILWFNAIVSIAVPLAVIIFWFGYSAQMSVIQEELQKKWRGAPF